jgi:hypothetical protein
MELTSHCVAGTITSAPKPCPIDAMPIAVARLRTNQ